MKKCIVCNSDFNPTNNRQKYCSDECKKIVKNNRRNKYSREEIENTKSRKCLICNDDFSVNSKQMTKKYCSDECKRKAERVFGNKTEVDLQYKDEIRFSGNRYKVLERDEYTCQMCGNTHQLVIHHIDNSGQSDEPNNDIDNLVTLCRRCHINIHKINNTH